MHSPSNIIIFIAVIQILKNPQSKMPDSVAVSNIIENNISIAYTILLPVQLCYSSHFDKFGPEIGTKGWVIH